MNLGLAGRAALVTGASKGIGRGIATALAAEGACVAISSRSREHIAAAAAEIGATGLVWDSGDVGGAAALVETAEEALGAPIDVLVCNTGGPPAGADALGFSRDQWEAAHRSLVLAPVALVAAVMPGMRARRWGRILNVSSTSVREPIPAIMLSNTERAGVLAAFKTISRQVAGDGVTLNTLLTGQILTDRLIGLAGSVEAAHANARERVPARRPGTVEEIAAVAAFLCGEQAAYVTGTAIPVDGGMLQGV
jgi:3-oxoacyl-[acyl-carrier protein] reductase